MAQQINKSVAFPLASAVLAATVSCGPRTDMDPVEARAKFSSKSLSMGGAVPTASPADSEQVPETFERVATEPSQHASADPASNPAPVVVAAAPQRTPVPLFAPEPSAAQPVLEPSVAQAVAEEKPTVPPSDTKPVASTTVAQSQPLPEAAVTATVESSIEVKPAVQQVSIEPSKPEAPGTQTVLNAPPLAAATDEAHRILVEAARSKWPALRANALEAAMRSPRLLEEIVQPALADENRGVRFVACMTIAEARDRRFSDRVRPLLSDPSASVRAAAMLALSRAEIPVNFSPLAAMVLDNDPEIRANAYLVLGELGNSSAIPLIRESLGKGMKLVNPLRVRLVDLAAAEALVKLGDQNEIEPIRAALFAPPEQGELTVVACDAIRRLHDEGARPMLERIVTVGGKAQRSPEITLAACRALAALGNAAGPAAIAREYVKHPDARVRSQAAALLGDLGTAASKAELAALLRDQNPSVQIAAAGGLEATRSLGGDGSFQAQAD